MAMCRQWNRWAHGFCGPHMQGDEPAHAAGRADRRPAIRPAPWPRSPGRPSTASARVCLGNSVIYGPKQYGELEYNNPELRADVEPDRGDGPGRHLPRLDRARSARRRRRRRGDHQLRLPLDGDDDRAAGADDRLRRVRAASAVCTPAWSRAASASCPGCWRRSTTRPRAHHFWVRPQLKELPSAYFRRNCFATFQDDAAGLKMAEAYDLDRQLPLGQRLSAPRGVLAALRRGHRAQHGRASPRSPAPRSSASTPPASSASIPRPTRQANLAASRERRSSIEPRRARRTRRNTKTGLAAAVTAGRRLFVPFVSFVVGYDGAAGAARRIRSRATAPGCRAVRRRGWCSKTASTCGADDHLLARVAQQVAQHADARRRAAARPRPRCRDRRRQRRVDRVPDARPAVDHALRARPRPSRGRRSGCRRRSTAAATGRRRSSRIALHHQQPLASGLASTARRARLRSGTGIGRPWGR